MLNSISDQWPISLPPENIRKSQVFWRFLLSIEIDHWPEKIKTIEMKVYMKIHFQSQQWKRYNNWLHVLTLSWKRLLSYRNHSIDLQSKLMDWFLYDRGLQHKELKVILKVIWLLGKFTWASINLKNYSALKCQSTWCALYLRILVATHILKT